MDKIYLDNNASTQIDPLVLEMLVKVAADIYGNPSSVHSQGREARAIIAHARQAIASYLQVRPEEILFTSGATEGNNLLIRGLIDGKHQGHLITSLGEHSSVFKTCRDLEDKGCAVTYLPIGELGAPTPQEVEAAIRPDTRAIILMAVNNETGVITDIDAIASIAQKANIPLIVDAVALLGKGEVAIPSGLAAYCFSGHKIHAPKGIGVVYINRKLKISPQLLGGSHEYSKRAGTENVAAIAALAKAVELLEEELPRAEAKMEELRISFERTLKKLLPEIEINGKGPRICNCSNISFIGADGEALLAQLDKAGIACSHGSACGSGALEPSRVLLSMGLPMARARSSIRFSLSRLNTEKELMSAAEVIARLVTKQRNLTGVS